MTVRLKHSITKKLEFSASHQLDGLPPEHPCTRNHGHNYVVFLTLEADELDEYGFVVDYTLLQDLIRSRYDHYLLNDVMRGNPTAEGLAEDIAASVNELLFRMQEDRRVRLVTVRVKETPTDSATLHIAYE